MKIVQFIGGLGNQMFQYAFYKSLKKRFNDVKGDISGFDGYRIHNGFELKKVFNLSVITCSEKEKRRLADTSQDRFSRIRRSLVGVKKTYYLEKPGRPDKNILLDDTDKYYSGYWQSESYFTSISEEIRQDFTFHNPLEGINAEVADRIGNCNAVSIHVRRGDYVTNPDTNKFHGVCGLDYYVSAIERLQSEMKDITYFIFSDDISWVKQNLVIPGNSYYIDHNGGQSSYEDMRLMTLCKCNIIANSTFSWWAAWLNNNPEKIVIAPLNWFNDADINSLYLLPESWIKI